MSESLPKHPEASDNIPPKRNFSEDQINERLAQVRSAHEEIKSVDQNALKIFQDLLDYLKTNKIDAVPDEVLRLQNIIDALEKVIRMIRAAALKSESKKPEEYADTVKDCIAEIIAFSTEQKDPEIRDFLEKKTNYLQRYVLQIDTAQQNDPTVSGPMMALKVREVQLFDKFGQAYTDIDAELGEFEEIKSVPQETRRMLMDFLKNCLVMSKKADGMKSGSAAQLVEDYEDMDEYYLDLKKFYKKSLQVNVVFDEEAVRKEFRERKSSILQTGNKEMVQERSGDENFHVQASKHLPRVVDDIGNTSREEKAAIKKARKEAEEKAANTIPDLKALRQEMNHLDEFKKEIKDVLTVVADTSNKIQKLLKNVGLEKSDGDKSGPTNLGNTQMIDLLKSIDEVEAQQLLEEIQDDEIGNDTFEGLAVKFGKQNVIVRRARKAQQMILDEEAEKKKLSPPGGGEAAVTETTPAETSTAAEATPEAAAATDNPDETRPPGYGEALPPVSPTQAGEDVAGTEEFDLDDEEDAEGTDTEDEALDEDEESEDDDKDYTDPKAPKA